VSDKTLRRYTDLPAALYMLRQRKITLLDPSTWDDSNDSYYMSLYKERKGLKTLLALCFAQTKETYHHWRVFANGSSGVCIEFEPQLLTSVLKKRRGLRMQHVQYLTLRDVREEPLLIDDLPFRKRYAFEEECEFRVIFEAKTKNLTSLDIDLPLSCIARITLSPWIAGPLAEHVRATIKALPGCERIPIPKSTLIANDEWKAHGDKATKALG
jgi:hypothetical protein